MQTVTSSIKQSDIKLGWGERLGFGVGNVGTMALFTVVSSFLTIYLTNVALLDIAVVSVIMAVSRVFDGISDLIAGNTIDRTNSRFGKARSWLLRMCLPLSLSGFLLFWVPAAWPNYVKYIYVFLLYNLFSTVAFTFTQVSQFSLVALMTADGREQALLGNIQSVFSTVGSLCCSLFFVKLLPFFSNDPQNPEMQSAYTGAVAVFCVAAAILTLISVFAVRERVKPSAGETKKAGSAGVGSFLQTAKALLSNRYWVFMFVLTVMMFFNVQVDMAGAAYFASYVLGDLGAISWILSSTLISSSLIQLITPALMRRFGKRSLCMAGLGLCAVGLVGLGLCVPNQTAMLACNVVRGIGTGITSALQLGMIADTIRYTEYRSGIYSAGMGNAGITAARKIGHGIGSAVYGLVLAAAGFSALRDTQHLPQPQSVVTAITWMYVWVPMLLYALSLLLFFLFFHLERELTVLEGARNSGTGV